MADHVIERKEFRFEIQQLPREFASGNEYRRVRRMSRLQRDGNLHAGYPFDGGYDVADRIPPPCTKIENFRVGAGD